MSTIDWLAVVALLLSIALAFAVACRRKPSTVCLTCNKPLADHDANMLADCEDCRAW